MVEDDHDVMAGLLLVCVIKLQGVNQRGVA